MGASREAVTATGCRLTFCRKAVSVKTIALSIASAERTVVKFAIYLTYIAIRGIIIYSDRATFGASTRTLLLEQRPHAVTGV